MKGKKPNFTLKNMDYPPSSYTSGHGKETRLKSLLQDDEKSDINYFGKLIGSNFDNPFEIMKMVTIIFEITQT